MQRDQGLFRLTAFSTIAFCSVCLAWNAAANAVQNGVDNLLTVAEESGFRRTSLSAEVLDFVRQCCQADHVTEFTFGETVEHRPLQGAIVSRKPYKLGDRDDRLRVLLLGNIHSGECDGKEALCMILRQLAQHPDNPWLDNMVILIAPNYNADGNDQVGPNNRNRREQDGPEMGMGVRTNAQQLDLNREFMKLESPEARSLVKLIDRVDPQVFVDCHTTDGSLHQYGLTYDVPHNPASPPSIRDYMREKYMPTVTQRLESDGLLTFYYGNFDRDKTSWESFGFEPRYSTEYVGLRGRLGILSESYSHASYKDRIVATDKFVTACLQFAHENAVDIARLIADSDRDFVERAREKPQSLSLAMDAKMVPFQKHVTIKAWDDSGKPHDYDVAFVADFQPTQSVELPFAYVVPEEFGSQVDLLRRHGIAVEKLQEPAQLDVGVFRVDEIKRAPQAFQKHKMLSLTGVERTESRQTPAGSFVIRTAQPLGRLAAYLLEPTSCDGLTTWNFFDDQLETGKDDPVLRVLTPVDIKTTPVPAIDSSSENESGDR